MLAIGKCAPGLEISPLWVFFAVFVVLCTNNFDWRFFPSENSYSHSIRLSACSVLYDLSLGVKFRIGFPRICAWSMKRQKKMKSRVTHSNS